jgi:hypothetical protein
MLCLLNVQRAAAGQPAFRRDARLDGSAGFHSGDMARYHYFAHRGPNRPPLLDRVLSTGYFTGAYNGLYAENIGEGPEPGATARGVVAAWMDSSDHSSNILDPRLVDIGIGSTIAAPDPAFYVSYDAALFVTDFGRRDVASGAAIPAASAPPAKCVARRTRATKARRHRRGHRSRRRRYCLTNPSPPVGAPAGGQPGAAAPAQGGAPHA